MKKNFCEKQRVMNLENINKTYKTKSKEVKVLQNLSIEFFSHNFYAIMGHSGSGKSTLINILGLIDTFDNGSYELYGLKSKEYKDIELSKLRMEHIGFIFQGFHLKPTLKAYENVMIPMLINKNIPKAKRKDKATELLGKVGLIDRLEHFPKELSGGEQQRVAIARALANNPTIILADEPTGNLDEKTEQEIFKLLKDLSREGKCVIVVSHSEYVKEYADKVYKLKNGKLVGDE